MQSNGLLLVSLQAGSRQHQNASSSRKVKQQNYSNLAKASSAAPSNFTSPPTEFQAIWTQLQVSIVE